MTKQSKVPSRFLLISPQNPPKENYFPKIKRFFSFKKNHFPPSPPQKKTYSRFLKTFSPPRFAWRMLVRERNRGGGKRRKVSPSSSPPPLHGAVMHDWLAGSRVSFSFFFHLRRHLRCQTANIPRILGQQRWYSSVACIRVRFRHPSGSYMVRGGSGLSLMHFGDCKKCAQKKNRLSILWNIFFPFSAISCTPMF